jgi:4-amino-4-deoxy-L-arabinose transferase-like glycosyltransferase
MTSAGYAQPQVGRQSVLRISGEIAIVVLLLAITFGVRSTNLLYNTLFVDEAIYVLVGQDVWQGQFEQRATSWMYGSYLYPAVAAVLDALGGVIGLRLASALMGTLAAAVIFLATIVLFDNRAALWAVLAFALTPVSINLGQFAVQDALAVVLLCVALFCLVKASCSSGTLEAVFLQSAAISFVLAAITKYFVTLYLPAALLVAAACYLAQNRPVRPLVSRFLGPVLVALCIYAAYHHADLWVLFNGPFGVQPGRPGVIATTIWNELGLLAILALGALGILAWEYRRQSNGAGWRRVLLWCVLLPLLVMAFFAGALYHVLAANQHSVWKHTIYTLVFLAPLAGYACARLVGLIGALRGRRALVGRLAGAAITSIVLVWFAQSALDRGWGFQHSWPNVTGVLTHLRAAGYAPNQRVLAEGAHVYQYYLGRSTPENWQDTWYAEYGDLRGQAALRAAVRDQQFDTVILDDFYTPGVRAQLEPALHEAGYRVAYEESQNLSSGETILIRVYERRS